MISTGKLREPEQAEWHWHLANDSEPLLSQKWNPSRKLRVGALTALMFGLAASSLQAEDPTEELIRQSEVLHRKHASAEALTLLQEAERLKPEDAGIQRRLAQQYSELMVSTPSKAKQKELGDKALHAAEKAVALAPQNAKARLSLAIVLGRVAQRQNPRVQVEMSKRIREEAMAATALDPKEDYAWHVLGRWNYELANFNPLLKSFAEVIYGKFPDATNENAARAFQMAIAVGPPRVSHHVEYGRTLLALGKKDEARQQIEKGLSLPSIEKEDESSKILGRKVLESL